ncbi:hypothetical protein KAJ02_00055 [Candidatus Bipolaricaulota bacterium]|nr:hypothetical protein [Candidatus Bipolaricaulota bacterium]
MDASSWILPVIIVAALFVSMSYFVGRRRNALLMKEFAAVTEKAIKPLDQSYTWVGGYIGYKAEYKVKDEAVKAIKATLHLLPRMSVLYYPVSRFTMRHDKLYIVIESKKSLPGEAHLIKKGQYRFVPPGLDKPEQFTRREVFVGGVDFQLLSLDSRGGKELLQWAESLKVDDYSMVKHLSFTSSTNVVYAYIAPEEKLIEAILRTAPTFVKTIAR